MDSVLLWLDTIGFIITDDDIVRYDLRGVLLIAGLVSARRPPFTIGRVFGLPRLFFGRVFPCGIGTDATGGIPRGFSGGRRRYNFRSTPYFSSRVLDTVSDSKNSTQFLVEDRSRPV